VRQTVAQSEGLVEQLNCASRKFKKRSAVTIPSVRRSSIIAANSLIRLAYGVAALASPSRARAAGIPLAPDTDQLLEARLFVRGFSSHQVAVALLGLASIMRRDLRRPAMQLAAAIDLADIISAIVEGGARSRLDRDLSGGILFSAAGFASALVASRAA
jgi:hypothetical protein